MLAISTNYLESVKKSLLSLRHRLAELELAEYDMGKASLIEEQVRRVENIYSSLQAITNKPEFFLINKK